MFLKLLPDQIMRYWDEIKESVDAALPPHVEPNYVRIQEQFLTGEMDCWVSYVDNVIRTIITTQVITDTVTDTRQFLIFSVTSVEEHTSKTWPEMYTALLKYARSKGCSRAVAYTSNVGFKLLAEQYGADCTWYLLSWEI
jgi:hypothetical protein